jgi:predicted acylesterase/phospholipase RssA
MPGRHSLKLRDATECLGKTAALGLALAGSAMAAGCATIARLDTPPNESLTAAPPGFSQPIRSDTLNRAYFEANASRTTLAMKAAADASIDILALSGGGAGGSFGAGVMVGLTESGKRPKFEVVTGVSTGALISTFAFLGPEYDGKLAEAYGGKATVGMLKSRGIATLFGVGLYNDKPLRDIVNTYITDEMIDEVGKEAATGRLLLVATTNLDREETTIWNMGAIAMQGDDKARKLYREVLIASSSVPGVFPPVMIEVEDDGKIYAEMHVDGGASTPFFVVPDIALIIGFQSEELFGANIYVVINGQAASAPRETKNNTMEIVSRSFTTVLNHMTRTSLAQTEAFAARNSMRFVFTAIPHDVQFGGSLAFDEKGVAGTFNYGRRCAAAGRVWVTPKQALDHVEAAGGEQEPPETADCPLVDAKEVVGRN